MTAPKLSTLLLSISLLALPGAFWLEKTETSLWSNRLLGPQQDITANLHTPHHTDGTYLPPTIDANRTLTAADNPVILPGTTTVFPNATLTVEPGVEFYAHEHAALLVAGTLNLAGTADDPIYFTSNEIHPANRSWAGIQLASNSRLTANHTNITYAVPGVSCQAGSEATLRHLLIAEANTGLFIASESCQISDSRILARQTGIISTIPDPPVSQTTIQAPREIQIIETN